MNNYELVEWQRIDPDNGLVEPWWTWPCMAVIKTWDLKDKIWLEFGAGLSTAWLRSRCKWVDSIEANNDWAAKAAKYCNENGQYHGIIHSANLSDGIQEQKQAYFDLIPSHYGGLSHEPSAVALLFDRVYDIISVDGMWRNECLKWAIDHFKGRGGILVVDNMDQDFVWISPAANELMASYPCEIYYQPGHTNHEGKSWNTRIYTIPA